MIKSKQNKVVVFHKKKRTSSKKDSIASEPQIPSLTPSPKTSIKSKLPMKTFVFNPLLLQSYQGKEGLLNLSKHNKDFQEFMSFLPKPKTLSIEPALFTQNELEEFRKIQENHSEHDSEKWSVREYDTHDFDLENVYEDFLDPQKSRILQRKSRKLKNSLMSAKPNELIDHSPHEFEEEELKIEEDIEKPENEKKMEKSVEYEEMKDIIKKLEEYGRKLYSNPIQRHRNSYITREEILKRTEIISNVSINMLIDFHEASDFQASVRITFHLKNLEEQICLDYSGSYIISISINGKSYQANELWMNQKILLSNLKEGQNTVLILIQNSSFKSLFIPKITDFIDPNENKENFENKKNHRLFYKDENQGWNMIFPCFDQIGLKGNFVLGLLVPKHFNAIFSYIEKIDQFLTVDSKFNSLQCHENLLKSIDDLQDKRILLYQGNKLEFFSLGICIGEFTLVHQTENIRVFSHFNHDIHLNTLNPIIEIIKLAIVTFKKLIDFDDKIDIIFLSDILPKVFSHKGIIYLNKLFLNLENITELHYILIKEVANQFLIAKFWFDDIWLYKGLPNYLTHYFIEQISDIDNISQNLPYNELLVLFQIHKNIALFQQKIGYNHPLLIQIQDNYQLYGFNDPIFKFKPIYLFKQLALSGSKKVFQDFLHKISNYFSSKNLLTALSEFYKDENIIKNMENWLQDTSIDEFSIIINEQNNEKLSSIKDINIIKNNQSNLIHFTDLALLNQSGRNQFCININLSENTNIIKELEKKYVPKAILLDSENSSFLIYQPEGKTLIFLLENWSKIEKAHNRLQAVYFLFFLIFDQKIKGWELLDSIVKNLEKENSLLVIKQTLKIAKKIMFYSDLNDKIRIYSEKFVILIIKLIEQGRYVNYLYKNIAKFAKLPEFTHLLESIFLEKHTSFVSFYKTINFETKLYLLVRLLSCESISNEKRLKYIEIYLDSINSLTLQKKYRVFLYGITPNQNIREGLWEKLHDEKYGNILWLKFWNQKGQYICNKIFADKYFDELPLVLNKNSEEYGYLFTKYLFPIDLEINIENKIEDLLGRIDEKIDVRVFRFLQKKILEIKNMNKIIF